RYVEAGEVRHLVQVARGGRRREDQTRRDDVAQQPAEHDHTRADQPDAAAEIPRVAPAALRSFAGFPPLPGAAAAPALERPSEPHSILLMRAPKAPSNPLSCGVTVNRPRPSSHVVAAVSVASIRKTGCLPRNASIRSTFSSGSSVHVEYRSRPPGAVTLAAASSISACRRANVPIDAGSSRQRASGWRDKVPVPEQGTSSRTASSSRRGGR